MSNAVSRYLGKSYPIAWKLTTNEQCGTPKMGRKLPHRFDFDNFGVMRYPKNGEKLPHRLEFDNNRAMRHPKKGKKLPRRFEFDNKSAISYPEIGIPPTDTKGFDAKLPQT